VTPPPEESIFGTDGIRDRPGQGFLSHQSLERLVRSTASLLRESRRFPEDFPGGDRDLILIARDTRESGEGLRDVLSEVFTSCGHTVIDVGVLPTPGAAFLASAWKGIALGVVISASHNPAEYNGVKFVTPTGAKISPDFENAVTDAFWRNSNVGAPAARGKIVHRVDEAFEKYAAHLVQACRRPERLKGHRVLLDLSNGATFHVAPEVFRRLGLRVETMADAPTGRNINENCGALHPGILAQAVADRGASFGFCFDGDGDRMIPIAAGGTILNGDHVLLLGGVHFLRAGRLPRQTVVATVMSNVGLEVGLRHHGISLLRTDVGDRNVYRAMIEGGHPLGGEQSGHLIFLEDARTGDGILAALRLLDVLESDSLDLEREASAMRQYPQLLVNVRVPEKKSLESLPAVACAVKEAEDSLGDEGRVLLRYSGTEPVLRVMVEGPEQTRIRGLTSAICDAIKTSIPGSK